MPESLAKSAGHSAPAAVASRTPYSQALPQEGVGTGHTNLRRLPAHGHDQVGAGRHLRPPVARANHGVVRGLLGIEGRRRQRSRSRPAAPRLLRELHRAATNAFPKRANKTISIHGYNKKFFFCFISIFRARNARRNQSEMRVSRGFGRRTEAWRSPRDDRGGAGCCDGDECAQRRPDGGGRECRVWDLGVRTPPSPFVSGAEAREEKTAARTASSRRRTLSA